MKLRFLALSLALASMMSAAAMASSPASGWWKGTLMQRLPIVFHITPAADDASQLTGVVFSPAQTADSFPLDNIILADSMLSFEMPALHASFEGKLVDGSAAIDGALIQGMKLPLRLVPATPDDAKVQRPQTPKPPFLYRSEDITFAGPDTITIGGTLTSPFMPAVGAMVLVSGSGAQNRDEEILGHKPFAVIADYLTRMGWAVLRCDDRGVGATSAGTPDDTTLDYVDDAMHGVAELRRRYPSLPVGILGHSEGGTIALYNAAHHPDSVDFIISLAGMAINGRDLMIRQNEMLAEHSGQKPSDESHALMVKVFDAIRQPGTPTEVASRLDSLYSTIEPDSARRAPTVRTMSSPWYIEFVRLDPTKWIGQIKCPVLALGGSWDIQVEAEPNLQAIAEAVPHARTILMPGLNHMLQESASKAESFNYGSISQTISPQALDAISAFLIDFTRRQNKK